MKRKCSNCKTEFYFKAKDLEPTKSKSNVYLVICPFCLTPKRVFYNHIPRHVKRGV